MPRLEVRTRDRGGFGIDQDWFPRGRDSTWMLLLGACVTSSNESVIRLSKLGQVEKNDAS